MTANGNVPLMTTASFANAPDIFIDLLLGNLICVFKSCSYFCDNADSLAIPPWQAPDRLAEFSLTTKQSH